MEGNFLTQLVSEPSREGVLLDLLFANREGLVGDVVVGGRLGHSDDEMTEFSILGCGGLTPAGCQVPTKAALSLPSSTGQGRENITKRSWVEIRTGRSLSSYLYRQNRLDLGKLVYYQSNQSRIMRNKTKS